MQFDDDLNDYLAKLRLPRLVQLTCPNCRAVVVGKGGDHAQALLLIHQEGTCQGGKGVARDGGSDSARADSPDDVPRLTRMYHDDGR